MLILTASHGNLICPHRYDAANHAKAHMLLTNRAEPSSEPATTALAALAGADSAASAVASAATVPGGPGRWLLPAADAGEAFWGRCNCTVGAMHATGGGSDGRGDQLWLAAPAGVLRMQRVERNGTGHRKGANACQPAGSTSVQMTSWM